MEGCRDGEVERLKGWKDGEVERCRDGEVEIGGMQRWRGREIEGMERRKDGEMKISRDGDRGDRNTQVILKHTAQSGTIKLPQREKVQVRWCVDGLTGCFNPTHTAQ